MRAYFVCLWLSLYGLALADWPGFRGPEGDGISRDEASVPATWSESEHLIWKVDLPGWGSSSPIVYGGKVFVTCYSGYGTVEGSGTRRGGPSVEAGDPGTLKRHVLCFDAATGERLWEETVAATGEEDEYRGYLTEHGYASATPVTDGQRVYVVFGKSGAYAFDFESGETLWAASLGEESNSKRWGSGSSPILWGDYVIVTASSEDRSMKWLNRETGEEVHEKEAGMFDLAFGTPAVVTLPDGEEEIVMGVPEEVWAFDPETAKLKWYASIPMNGNLSPSIVSDDKGVVYVYGGYRTKGSMAIRAGGDGDVSDSRVIWKSPESSYIPSPVWHEGHLYWINERGKVTCADAATGEVVNSVMIDGDLAGGPKSRSVYASMVLADGKLYGTTRVSGTFVFEATPELKQLAQNVFAGDESDFNGSVAVSDGRIYLRSNEALYCVGE